MTSNLSANSEKIQRGEEMRSKGRRAKGGGCHAHTFLCLLSDWTVTGLLSRGKNIYCLIEEEEGEEAEEEEDLGECTKIVKYAST